MNRMARGLFLRSLGHLLFGLCCIPFFLACGSDTSEGTAVLRVVTEAEYPPFSFGSTTDNLQGFDIDIIKAVADVSDFRVVFGLLQFDEIIPALQEGKFDIGIDAITITAERQEIVDFSIPYFETGQSIAVQKDNTDITDLESLKYKSIGVQSGTTGAELAAGVEGAVISTFDTISAALQELVNGTLDAVINDEASTRYAIKEGTFEGIKLVGELLSQEFYGIALPKGSRNLQRINEGLMTIFENGTYTQIYEKWFNALPNAAS